MLNQSAEENLKASHDIERLLTKDLKDTVKHYVQKYGKTLERKLGLTKDDLLNDMREQIWKGLLTHNPNGRANLKTYLNKLITNRFGVLYKRSTIQKYNTIQYYADVFTTSGIDEESLITEETGETVFERRQIVMQDQARLSKTDRLIYESLILGRNLEEMTQVHKLPRSMVIRAINRIDTMIRARIKRGDNEQD
jgi:DNA-directed RNA polymerase specialized sigma24 family protein